MIERFADWFVGKEVDFILKPLGAFLKACAVGAGKWFLSVLPDVMGYGAIVAGGVVILYAMAGAGYVKPLAVYAGLLIVAVCVLGGV